MFRRAAYLLSFAETLGMQVVAITPGCAADVKRKWKVSGYTNTYMYMGLHWSQANKNKQA